jgi:hypothetical protein
MKGTMMYPSALAGYRPTKTSFESPFPASTKKIAPDVRWFDTLLHPLANTNPRNPGTLIVATNSASEWERIDCSPGSMLHNIEIRPSKGLLNLTASADFVAGRLSPSQKRDLQRAITAVVMTYNEWAEKTGSAFISIHENHWLGDGKVYEARQIPREPNERSYDYYHTLGVNLAENGRMMPHYHLEFARPLDKRCVSALLLNLHRIRLGAGHVILRQSDIAQVLRHLPQGQTMQGADEYWIEENRQQRHPLPNELETPEERARCRDELESAFVALSSANTARWGSTFLRNAYMSSWRPVDAFECFPAGHTSLVNDLQRIEKAPDVGHGLSVSDLMAIHQSFKNALGELARDPGGSPEERQAVAARLQSGMERTKELLSLPPRRPR